MVEPWTRRDNLIYALLLATRAAALVGRLVDFAQPGIITIRRAAALADRHGRRRRRRGQLDLLGLARGLLELVGGGDRCEDCEEQGQQPAAPHARYSCRRYCSGQPLRALAACRKELRACIGQPLALWPSAARQRVAAEQVSCPPITAAERTFAPFEPSCRLARRFSTEFKAGFGTRPRSIFLLSAALLERFAHTLAHCSGRTFRKSSALQRGAVATVARLHTATGTLAQPWRPRHRP